MTVRENRRFCGEIGTHEWVIYKPIEKPGEFSIHVKESVIVLGIHRNKVHIQDPNQIGIAGRIAKSQTFLIPFENFICDDITLTPESLWLLRGLRFFSHTNEIFHESHSTQLNETWSRLRNWFKLLRPVHAANKLNSIAHSSQPFDFLHTRYQIIHIIKFQRCTNFLFKVLISSWVIAAETRKNLKKRSVYISSSPKPALQRSH